MIESVIIAVLFAGALFYLGWLVYRSFFSTTCNTGCGKCNAIDVDSLEKKVRMRESSLR